MAEERDDGVKRNGLDFRAGWVEALGAFLQRLQMESARCKKGERAGMETCHGIALKMRQDMIAKMSGGDDAMKPAGSKVTDSSMPLG
mgnify:FL=1